MFEPTIKQTEPMKVAFIAMRGPWSQIPDAMGRLYRWVQSRGYTPTGMPTGVFLTNPAEVPAEEAVWELWAPILGALADSGPDDAGFGVKFVPTHTVASVVHKGPYESIAPTYGELTAWVAAQGYHMAGPPRESYMSDPKEVPPEEYLTEVQLPVAR